MKEYTISMFEFTWFSALMIGIIILSIIWSLIKAGGEDDKDHPYRS